MPLPKSVKLVEVGPRDGLQNESKTVPTETKIELIDRLSRTGLRVIETGSFVSPKWVPQMADTAAVLARIARSTGASYPGLVPNMRGLEVARAAGVRDIAVFAAASETFSRKNINASIDESLERYEEVCASARAQAMTIRGYISCVLWCPYEGRIEPAAVARVAERLLAMGCYEISLGETIGKGTPGEVQNLIAALASSLPREKLAVHFHDTYGQALANVFAALELGIATVDSSVAGLGGCPYAPGATGNVATEDVLYMLNGLGISTGVDLPRLVEAGRFISDHLGRPPVSRANRALSAKHDSVDRNSSRSCPVCGFELWFVPWEETSGSDEICPSCGIQFGYDDAAGGNIESRAATYREWRQRWIEKGTPWSSVGQQPPPDWNPRMNLARFNR